MFDLKNVLKNVVNQTFHGYKIYIPRCYLPGQELAPSPILKGCQRVIEPDLSPLLYKPTSASGRKIDHGISTNYVDKYNRILLNIPNFFLIGSQKSEVGNQTIKNLKKN